MADKTEIQIKAAEKRLDSIERSIETLRKDGSSNDAGAQLKVLSTKLEALGKQVETMAGTVKELGVQMVLKKDLKTATKLESDDRDREAKAQQMRSESEWKSRVDKETAARIAGEKEQRAQIDKMVSEQMLNARFMKLEADLATRIKVLEAQVASKR